MNKPQLLLLSAKVTNLQEKKSGSLATHKARNFVKDGRVPSITNLVENAECEL